MPFILERRLFPICSAFPRAINKPRDRCLDRSLLEFPKTFISSQTTQSYSLNVYSLNSLSALFENEILTCVFKKIHSFRNYVHIINNYKGLEWRWHAGDSDFFFLNRNLGLWDQGHLRLFFIIFGRAACGILVHRPEIEPVPAALEAWSPNHWTFQESPGSHLLVICSLHCLCSAVNNKRAGTVLLLSLSSSEPWTWLEFKHCFLN